MYLDNITKNEMHKDTNTQISIDKDIQWACWLLMDRCGVLNAQGQETTARNEFRMFFKILFDKALEGTIDEFANLANFVINFIVTCTLNRDLIETGFISHH